MVLAILAPLAGRTAVIYKWTDATGVVHYSDQPVPGAQKIYTAASPGTATSARAGATNGEPTYGEPTGGQREAPGFGYTQFAIASPAPEQSYFGDEAVTVSLALNPGLKSNHAITWRLNGKPIDDQGPATTQFNLPRLDRGTYAIAATITDQQSGESQSTDSVTFFVRQPSALSPQHQKP